MSDDNAEREFVVYLRAGASFAIKVTATDEQEAEEKAWDIGAPTLCHQCAHVDIGEWETDEVEDSAS